MFLTLPYTLGIASVITRWWSMDELRWIKHVIEDIQKGE